MQRKAEQTRNNLAILKAVLLSGRSIVGEYNVEEDELYIDPVLNDHSSSNHLFNYLKTHNYLSIQELWNLGRFGDVPTNNMEPLLQVVRGDINNCSFVCKMFLREEPAWVRMNS